MAADRVEPPCAIVASHRERRIIESIAGNENLEIQWRLATLKETKAVVTQYHKYLKKNSLIRPISDPEILPPEPKDKSA
ncbi:MAG: hypothetical protein WAK08_23770 [Pseudolabrys sp.]